MKFKYIGPKNYTLDDKGQMVEVLVNAYCGNKVTHGDVVEIDDAFFQKKAMNNPDYEQVKPGTKKKIEKVLKSDEEQLNLVD